MKRFLLVTLGITGLYLGLDTLWLAFTPALASLFEGRSAAAWEREAAEVASAARDADNRLPPETRLAAFRLGFQVGYCTNLLGSTALSPPQVQAQMREALAPRIKGAQGLGQALGVGEIAFLRVSNAEEFGRVPDRLDVDELGLASRLEAVTSRRHRHLLLLGMQVGVAASMTEASSGQMQALLRPGIGRHATLAGLPAAAWEPVATAPPGATAQEQVAAYQAAIAALEAAVAQLAPLR